MRCLLFESITICFFLLWEVSAFASKDRLPRVGQEFEIGMRGKVEPDATAISRDRPFVLLNEIRNGFGDPGGEIKFEQWGKWAETGALKATYVDLQGRQWEVVPEKVNTPIEGFDGRSGFDGLELVTPPLESEAEHRKLWQAMKGVYGSGLYGRGIQSSNHHTVEVRHLIRKDGNASRLRDLILAIESHWPEIYAAISPKRYGTVVNWFAIPLAADQPDLLRELQVIPAEECTMERIGKVFRKYHEQEKRLKAGDHRAWKYRAANYRKLFGLGDVPSPVIPAIEFRIPDLIDPREVGGVEAAARESRKITRFLRHLVKYGVDLEPSGKFRDRFHGTKVDGRKFNPFVGKFDDRSILKLSQRMLEVTPGEFGDFLKKLRMDPKKFGPPFRLIHSPYSVHWAQTQGMALRKEILGRMGAAAIRFTREGRTLRAALPSSGSLSPSPSALAVTDLIRAAAVARELEMDRGRPGQGPIRIVDGEVVLEVSAGNKKDVEDWRLWLEAAWADFEVRETLGEKRIVFGVGHLKEDLETFALARFERALGDREKELIERIEKIPGLENIPSPFELERAEILHPWDHLRLKNANFELRYELLQWLESQRFARVHDRDLANFVWGRYRAWASKVHLSDALVWRLSAPALEKRAAAVQALENVLRRLCPGR